MSTRIPARRALRRWRKQHGHTQAAVGKMIGKSRVLIQFFEDGKTQLQLDDRRKLAMLTGIPLAQWMTPNEVAQVRGTVAELGPEAA